MTRYLVSVDLELHATDARDADSRAREAISVLIADGFVRRAYLGDATRLLVAPVRPAPRLLEREGSTDD